MIFRVKDLIMGMLCVDPSRRLTAQQVRSDTAYVSVCLISTLEFVCYVLIY